MNDIRTPLRILALIFIAVSVFVLIFILGFYDNFLGMMGSPGGTPDKGAEISAPAAQEPESEADDEKNEAPAAGSAQEAAPDSPQSSDEGLLVEGTYVRLSPGQSKDCSLSAYSSLGIKKLPGDGGFVVIGDNDPRLEAKYPLSYDAAYGSCSFMLDVGMTKYYYPCDISRDLDSGKPKIKILRIRTVTSGDIRNISALPTDTSCDDGEEFILK